MDGGEGAKNMSKRKLPEWMMCVPQEKKPCKAYEDACVALSILEEVCVILFLYVNVSDVYGVRRSRV